MRIEINIKKYLTECKNKINEVLDKEKGVYLISGCGTGKTYFVKNYLCKNRNTLVINFLNIVNSQSYNDIYIEGKNVRYYNGLNSVSINVQQIENAIFVNNDDILKNIELIVIDEIQLQHLSCNYRPICGVRLKDFIDRCISLGIKILLITGTPIAPLHNVFGLTKIKVNKTEIEEKDKYKFTLIKGLTPFNCGKFIKNIIKSGKKVLLKTDRHTKVIEKLAKKENLRLARIYSDANKVVIDTPTKSIINEQKLPDEYDLFITTKVLVEGVNLLENPDEEVVIISFVDDIESPMSAIQLASRLRNQTKNLILGYSREEEFNLTKTYCGHSNTLGDSIFIEREKILSKFNSIAVWKSYIKNVCTCTIIDDVYNEGSETIEIDNKFSITLSDLAKQLTTKINEIDKEWKLKEKPFSKYFRVRATEKDDIEITDSGEGYYYILVPFNKWLVKSILRIMNKFINIEGFTDDEIIDFIEVENTYFTLLDSCKDNPKNEAVLKDYVNGIKGECFTTMLADALKCTTKAIKGGEEIALTKRMENKHIFSHLIILDNFSNTIKRLGGYDNPFIYKPNPFIVADTLEVIFIKERNNYINSLNASITKLKTIKKDSGSKGGKSTKTITLVNDSIGFSMVFSSSKDCDNYVRGTLGFSVDNMRKLRNSEVKGYKRV